MGTLQELLGKKEPESFGKINGKDVYDFKGEVEMGDRRNAEELLGGKMEFGERTTRDGGLGFTKSNIKSVAINPERYFMNRYRVAERDGKKIYQVVATMFGNDDYRVIKEQSTGRVFTDSIVVRLIGQGSSKGQLEYLGTETISADEFVKEFKGELNQESMQKVLNCIAKVEDMGTTKDKITF